MAFTFRWASTITLPLTSRPPYGSIQNCTERGTATQFALPICSRCCSTERARVLWPKRTKGNLQTARRALGADDPATLESAEHLGTILWHLGKSDEAEAMLRQNVADRRRILKAEHPDTLRSVYVLSRVLRERNCYPDAEQLAYAYVHSIQCSLGPNHPEYVSALANLADVYRDRGDLVQAQRLYGQAASAAHALLGALHPKTRSVEDAQARILQELARHAPAQ